ncbi:MAG: hypothetical protein ACREPD_07245 [Stenotrophomonas sp.]|uniref:hypothetical protein n=1 Tax=Stenotrophomonas sp. TaxID=69392 RepID=UPI003D6CA597
MNDLFDTAAAGKTKASERPLQPLESSVAVEVIYRSQVGACIPFTALPKHYLGKKVRLVIVGEADE